MNADPAVVYHHADFEYLPGLMLTYVGLTPPGSDRESLHAYAAPPQWEQAPVPVRSKSFVRKGALSPDHAALADAMEALGVSYRTLSERVGLKEKGFYYQLRYHSRTWKETYTAAALALGREDLLRFVAQREGKP